MLADACAQDGAEFAKRYSGYFNLTYGIIHANNPAVEGTLLATAFSQNAATELPLAMRGGRLIFSQFQQCRYFEGDMDYFYNGGLNPFGSFQTPGSVNISFFESVDPDFAKDLSAAVLVRGRHGTARPAMPRAMSLSPRPASSPGSRSSKAWTDWRVQRPPLRRR